MSVGCGFRLRLVMGLGLEMGLSLLALGILRKSERANKRSGDIQNLLLIIVLLRTQAVSASTFSAV